MVLDLGTDTSLTTVTLLVDGTDVTNELVIISIETGRMLDRIPYAQIVFQDGDPAEQTFALSEGPLFPPGAEIEILAGYQLDNEPIFKGIVTRQRIEAPLHGSSRLYVDLRHPAFRMGHARKSRIWSEVTDADAVGEIAQGHGINFDGSSPTVRPTLVQHQATDWDFTVQRAQMVGQAVLAEDGGLKLVTPGPGSPEADVEYGADVFAIEMEFDAERQPTEVETGAWGAADQSVATAASAGPPFVGPGNTDYAGFGDVAGLTPRERASGARDQAELDEWAGADALRRRISALRGLVELQGKAIYQPGMTVTLIGLGERFNGPAYVTGVRHQIGRGDWRSFLQIGLDPEFHAQRVTVDAPAAAGLLPGIRGLHVGVVDALEGDPAGEERVAVNLVSETETNEVVWARPLSIGGGADRGLVLLPEVGDEVLLGFLDGDPRDPILLGGVHSSAAASPYPGADDNHIKGLASRAGIKISFDDDAVVLTLETPGGHKVLLDDDGGEILAEDSNGNSITLSSDGIALESAADIKLKATGDIALEGTNVSLKATAEVTAEGSAGATLKSDGSTTIKGSVVMIN